MATGDQDSVARVRTLTERGESMYEATLDTYHVQVESAWRGIEDILINLDDLPTELSSFRKFNKDATLAINKYLDESDAFMSYLTRTHTAESLKELRCYEQVRQRCISVIDNIRKRLHEARLDAAETMSTGSRKHSDIRSEISINTNASHSSVLVKKRMEANAKRASLEYVKREIELQKRKAELDANLQLLEHQKETAALEAEVNVLENLDLHEKDSLLISNEQINRREQTARYVQDQADYNHANGIEEQKYFTCDEKPVVAHSQLNPKAQVFQPVVDEQAVFPTFSQFLLKRDLLPCRFINYNDRPEAYATWKASFTHITKEINVTPFEELDLLVKYLGPESSKYALSIRASNVTNPKRGLERIWERLEERYGSPELVESALKVKLREFPRLTYNDNKRLYDLADILAEIEATKENPKYSVLLSYFDSSSGIVPIISKLPHALQEKWTSRASSYKVRHQVPYPPFHYFVEFVKEISRVKNDPGFQYETFTNAVPKREAPRVSSRKTDMMPNIEHQNSDPLSRCPIHQTRHSIKECRSFRHKQIAVRMKLLKERRICYRCCESTSHVANDCKANVRCNECNSTSHHSALHVDISRKSEAPQAHGGEKASVEPKFVRSKCTQICGNTYSGKSCARNVLVRVYPEGHPEKAIKMYAMIDDQSNKSLARSEFFDLMGINSTPKEYTLSSCSGTVCTRGRRAIGYVVESLDGTETLNLPTLIECDEIPNIREEIPTRDVARCYDHLIDLV